MHKWNKVAILSNDANLVVLILYYVEKLVREGYKNVGLDMAQKIIPDTYQFILCVSKWVRTYINRIWYETKVVPKK